MQRVRHYSQLPGYQNLDRRAAELRSIAFQDVPERIGPFTVRPLTLRHYGIMRLMGSPFLIPFRTPTGAEVAALLWLLSPQFTPGNSPARRRHIKACRCFQTPPQPLFNTRRAVARWEARSIAAAALQAPLVKAGREYMEDALIDRPPAGSGPRQEPDYYCDETSIVATLARNYGWNEADILDMPLKRIFQYLKECRENFSLTELKQKPVMWNPTDRIRREYLEQINDPKNS